MPPGFSTTMMVAGAALKPSTGLPTAEVKNGVLWARASSTAVRYTLFPNVDRVWRVGGPPTAAKLTSGRTFRRWAATSDGQYCSFEKRYDIGAYLRTKSGKLSQCV